MTRKSGHTFVELLMGVFILSIGVLSTIYVLVKVGYGVQQSNDMVVAASHMESLFEEMQVSYPTLQDIQGADWNSVASSLGVRTLRDETFSASYSFSGGSDLLSVALVDSWVTKERTQSLSMVTEFYK